MAVVQKILVAVIVALCIAGTLGGNVRRDAPPASGQLEDIVSRAQATITDVSAQVATLLGVDTATDKDKVIEALNNQTQALGERINQFVGTLNKEVSTHSADFAGLLESVSSRLNESLANLRAATPGVQKQASEIQDQLTAGLNTFVQEAGKVAKAISGEAEAVQESLDKVTRTAVEQVVSIGNQVKESVQSALAEQEPVQA